MKMRAQFERDGATGVDGYNNPVTPVFANHLQPIPCYVWTSSRPEIIDGVKTAMVEDIRAIIPKGIDVTEKDRVASIRDRRGSVLYSGPILIESVIRQDAHLELKLNRIEGP